MWVDDQATHLIEMLRNATDPPRRRGAAWRHVDGDEPEDLLVADILENFQFLWEASSGDERWSEHGALSLGVLKTARGRSRLIPFGYKRELVIESRNHIGRGVENAQATPHRDVGGREET